MCLGCWGNGAMFVLVYIDVPVDDQLAVYTAQELDRQTDRQTDKTP